MEQYNNLICCYVILHTNIYLPIEATAQRILYIQEQNSENSLVNLFVPFTMPEELLKAHKANDTAVREAYGWSENLIEEDIVARLFELYHELT